MIEPGTKLGRYEISSKIGEGGMGEVYLARDTKLDRSVALKVLPPDVAADRNRMNRFVQEAKAASALNHPNIITIHEIDETGSGHFIATEFIDGETVRERVRRGPMKLGEALDVAVQVARALSAAHAANILHRDIKPENVMLRPDGIVKVLDFGLAKLAERTPPENVDSEAPTSIRTDAGRVVGTPFYMSPEQARGLEVDTRTDIFSFGVLIYEMLSGRLPFEGASANEIVASILSEKEVTPLARYARDLPVELERITEKALAKNRDERYQSVKDLLIDLQRLKHSLAVQATIERSASTPAGANTQIESVAPEYSGANASVSETAATRLSMAPPASSAEYLVNQVRSHKRTVILTLAILAVVIVAGALVYRWRSRQTTALAQPAIKSLAVLPLKSLDAGENYLGLGIADAVIRRISQTGELTVRPTSAVRRYLNDDTDAVTAARQLNADAVLEGSVQHAGDRLRVAVNLLRASDGASLWTDNFDMRMADIFTIQDTVAQQVATRLRLQLDPSQQARLIKRSTSNPIAYEFYVKGVYSLDLLSGHGYGVKAKPQAETTADLFKKAIAADPNYALAHAQLAIAYAHTAMFIEPTEPAWVELARAEVNQAQTLDPQLAETHYARALLLWSAYEGWQIEAAIREIRDAQQINPNFGHDALGSLYQHAGLEDLAAREMQRALDIDPTSDAVRSLFVEMPSIVRRFDESFAASQKFYGETKPNASYLMAKGRLDEAQKAIEELSAKEPDNQFLPQTRGLLRALKGDFRSAESEIPLILNRHPIKGPPYHHATYDIACIYALEGKSDEAVKWLKETAATGFPCYSLFTRDPFLNRIRQAPDFVQFMAEMKAQNEKYQREFGEGAT